MDVRLTPGFPVNSTTEPELDRFSLKGLKRQLNVLNPDDPHPAKLQVLNPVATSPEREINDRSVTRLIPFFYSDTNKPNKMIPWCTQFERIYESLIEERHWQIEAQLNALSDVQIKSLHIINPPSEFLYKLRITGSLFELASLSSEAGNTFFRVLFDRLTPEELRVALSESIDGDQTLLHYACHLMDEPLYKQLEQKLDRQTLLEMVTRPVNHHAPPLACACLYCDSTYLFDTTIEHNRESVVKLLKGSPGIDQTLLQFMFNDRVYLELISYGPLTLDKYSGRVKYLLARLNKQDHFDAVSFSNKANESALLWACTKTIDITFAELLTESLEDAQIAELCTTKAKNGNSLVQKCIELNRPDIVTKLCFPLRDPLLRFKVLSTYTSEGDSLLQQWLPDCKYFNDKIECLLRGMDDKHRELLIAGDRRIWDPTIDSTDHNYTTMSFSDFLRAQCGLQSRKYVTSLGHQLKIRQQERTPIATAINRKQMCQAKYLWKQIADPELQIKLLLYKTKDQTTLLQHMLDNEAQWQDCKNRLKNTRCQIIHDSFAAELCTHAAAAGRFKDAGYYFREISDPQLKDDLFDDFGKDFLLNHCNRGEKVTDFFVGRQNPSKCTESVIHVLEHSLYNQETMKANLLQLITLQKKAGNKQAFVTWATTPQQGKQCPLTTALSRFSIAHSKINNPECFPHIDDWKPIEWEACLNKRIFEGIMSMMSEEQLQAFFLSLQGSLQESLHEKSSKTLHLLGFKDILATTIDTLPDSGRAFLEQINPARGGNLLHILFEGRFIIHNHIRMNDLIKTLDWLDNTYGLTTFLQSRLENDGSTPLHVLLSTVMKISPSCIMMLPRIQKHILKQLCQPNVDGISLVELLNIKDNNGCTPLHKYFLTYQYNEEITELLIQELGRDTFYQLVNIQDKQGNTVMGECSTIRDRLHE